MDEPEHKHYVKNLVIVLRRALRYAEDINTPTDVLIVEKELEDALMHLSHVKRHVFDGD